MGSIEIDTSQKKNEKKKARSTIKHRGIGLGRWLPNNLIVK